jgi:diacylglycerol kinase (ATP)
LLRRARSFRYALRGLRELVRTQPNARIHLALACAATALGLLLGLSSTELAILALAIGLVFAAEAMNSAIEAVVDLVQPEWHPSAGAAKDLAAGAVLVAALASASVGLLLFVPRLLP